MKIRIGCILLMWLLLATGCRPNATLRTRLNPDVSKSPRDLSSQSSDISENSFEDDGLDRSPSVAGEQRSDESSEIIRVSAQGEMGSQPDQANRPDPDSELLTLDEHQAGPSEPLELDDVIQSINVTYPLLQNAFFNRNIAQGDELSAEGAWDLKLKADANNAPLGYYKTYRNGTGFEQPLYGGGEVFGLYKIGQGNFEPWYGNRETNQGGEFSAGIRIPLAQNRTIDDRRATLWKAAYGVGAVEPFIQAQIIEFTRAGSYSYWDWVAAGLNLRVCRELLELAEDRDDQIEAQVKSGARPESFLVDNRRLIVSRQVKLIEARRKLQNAAIKLSLFFRAPDGRPVVPNPNQLPTGFPEAVSVKTETMESDVQEALSRRPEITELNFQYRISRVDLQLAENQIQPELDASFWSAKDVGGWSTPSGNKAPYQAEAGLNFSVPLQRRKARGKVAAVEAKLVQIATKRQFAEDKIATEVQNALITIEAAYRAIEKARESVQLNEQMQQFEIVKLEKGDSDLLLVNLREFATFDARVIEIEAMLRYFEAQADYRAAMALDITPPTLPPMPN